MNKIHKVIKRVLRYEIGVFLKNSGFSYLYGSISYLFGYEKNRCFFLMGGGATGGVVGATAGVPAHWGIAATLAGS